MGDVKNANGKYGGAVNMNLVDKDGNRIPIDAIIKAIPKMIADIANISGSIDISRKLKDYKSQTAVFTTHTAKKEPNKFVVN